jgi:hypothetical protein
MLGCLFKPMSIEMAKNAFKPAMEKCLHLRLLDAFPSPSIVVAYRFVSVQIFRNTVSGQKNGKA